METQKTLNTQSNPEKEKQRGRNQALWLQIILQSAVIKTVWYCFPQYGKITISPNGFYWPFEQLKNTTLDNRSHISYTGIIIEIIEIIIIEKLENDYEQNEKNLNHQVMIFIIL